MHGAISYAADYNEYRGFAPPRNPPGVSPGRLVSMHFRSRALREERRALVYLPPGYAAAARRGQRFPVLYLLHGAPGRPELYMTAGAVGVKEDELLTHHQVRPFLIVIPDGTNDIRRNDSEWANTARGGRYEDLVLETVKAIDARFPTRARRRERAIAGLSEGGYGAINIALHHLRTFGTAESWSGYFSERAVGVFRGASPAVVAANSPAEYVASLAPELHRWPLRAYVYFGRKDSAPLTTQFVAQLRAAGAHVLLRRFHRGHNWGLWRNEMKGAMRFADHSFHRRTKPFAGNVFRLGP